MIRNDAWEKLLISRAKELRDDQKSLLLIFRNAKELKTTKDFFDAMQTEIRKIQVVEPLGVSVFSKGDSTREICFITADDIKQKPPELKISEESELHVCITFLPQRKRQLDELLTQIQRLSGTQEMLLKEYDFEVPYFNAVGC